MLTVGYVLYIIAVLAYSIYRYVYLYKTNKYDPNPFKREKMGKYEKILFVINLPIIYGGIFLIKDISTFYLLANLFVAYSAALIITISVLNYMVYQKCKEKKIIRNTFLYGGMITVLTTGLWLYVRGWHF